MVGQKRKRKEENRAAKFVQYIETVERFNEEIWNFQSDYISTRLLSTGKYGADQIRIPKPWSGIGWTELKRYDISRDSK